MYTYKATYYLAGCVGFCGACAGGVGAVGKDGTVDFAAPSVNVFTCSLEPTFGTTKAVITHKANKAIALPQVVFSITSPALCTPITLEAALPMPPLKPPPLGFWIKTSKMIKRQTTIISMVKNVNMLFFFFYFFN